MPPKAGRQGTGRSRAVEDNKEEPLQAVLIADTFESKFSPFSHDHPRCLIPLANTPLIEYSLEYLASAGAQDVYIYAGAHVDQVEQHIEGSKWSATGSPFKNLQFLRCLASSVGDVMRDLDQKHLITGDFICISGDVVSDFPIERALRQHKQRREKDKNAIMTMLLRETEPSANHYQNSIVPTFVIDPLRNRCLHYEEALSVESHNTHIDPEVLKSPELDIRQDLVDCRIDICTPDVLSLWSDNFDNQAPRKDFLYGVLKDYELNGKSIHTYIVKSYYASRAGDIARYDAIALDLKEGIVSSLSVENNVFSNTHYLRSKRGPIRDADVILVRPSNVDKETIIGAGTSIGARSMLKSSIIGQRCQVGKNTSIEHCHIWHDVTIGNNVKISRAIIGNEAFVGDNCKIGEDSMISSGVRIAAGTEIPAGSRITKESQASGLITAQTSTTISEHADEEKDYFTPRYPSLLFQHPEFADSVSSLASDASGPSSSVPSSRRQSFTTGTSEDDIGDRFQHDTVNILLQRMQEKKHADDMLSELMGLRFSGGADEVQVRTAVATALMKHIHDLTEAGESAADASRKTLQAYHSLIRRPHAEQATEEQVSFLLEVQKVLSRRESGGKTLVFVVKDLYDLEVFGEESFLAWWRDDRSSAEEEMAEVRKQSEQFIDWLESAESESEDNEEEDDDE